LFLQLVKYGFVGGISTLIHIGVASLYLHYIEKNVVLANVLAFCIAFIFSYTVQSLFVFQHVLEIHKLLKYFTVQFGSLLIALFISYFLVLENLYIQTIIISILLPLITFVIHKTWTFKEII